MESEGNGRWTIVLTDGEPPVFWSYDRATIEDVCRVIRRRCPGAQIVWVNQPAHKHREQEDVPETQ